MPWVTGFWVRRAPNDERQCRSGQGSFERRPGVTSDPGASISPADERTKRLSGAIALAALGIVFGDIGTSPLYTLKTCFTTAHVQPTPANVIGIVSALLWTLIAVVCVKYVTFVMQVDYRGEGGIFALLARLLPAPNERIVLLTIESAPEPFVDPGDRVTVENLSENRIIRVRARFGFMELPMLEPIAESCSAFGLHIEGEDTSYIVASPQIVAKPRSKERDRMMAPRRWLFDVMQHLAGTHPASLGIPADQLVELGVEVPM